MPGDTPLFNHLYEAVAAAFNLAELQDLCFDLRVPYEHLPGETLPGKARELVQYLERHHRLAELLPRLKELRPHSDWNRYEPAEPEAPPPFKGLHYFDEGDAPLFFGRETLTAELVAHLRQHRFLAVVGASGSGKSSLVRAGVVPAVRRGAIEGPGGSSAGWPIHVIAPGDEPLKALAASLTRESESVSAAATLLEDLRQSSESLDLFLYRQMSGQGTGRLLLVVDQFEELFTQCDDGEARRRLVENLVQAVQSGKQGRLTLILALRADFYAYAVQYEGLRPLLETRQKIVGAMNQEELRRAIEAPAERGNWAFQPGLVETILQDVGQEPGALPLLSHALQETWARREGRVMTLGGYQAAGGVRRAIAQTADQVYASLTPEQQVIARNIFLRLTELGEGTEDTRRRAPLAELLPQDGRPTEVQAVLDLLARRRLVILDEERAKAGVSQNYVEVAHEALIREWPTLRGWLDENREGLRLHRQLAEMAEAWDAAGGDASYLYRGGRLVQAQEWAGQNLELLNDLEHRFLTTSQQVVKQEEEEREARRQKELEIARQQVERANTIRRATWGLLVMFTIAVGAAFIAFVQRGVAQDNLATATIAQGEAQINLAEAIEQARIAQSQALAASSQAVSEQDPMEALLLAIAAGQTAETALAMDALNLRLPIMAKPLFSLNHGGSVYGAIWNKNESQLLSWSSDGTAKVWDPATGELLLTLNQESLIYGAAWNENESRILSWSSNGVKIWDAATGKLLLTLGQKGSVSGAAWNRDSSRILNWKCYETNEFGHCTQATVEIWDATTGNLLMTLSHKGSIIGTIWNSNEDQLLSWGCDETNEFGYCTQGSLKIWDANTGEHLLSLSHESTVYGAVWNSDESQILSWSNDGTAKVWDVNTGEHLLTLSHESMVYGAVWNSDESQILSWSDDGTAKVWDANTGERLLTLSHESMVYGAVWNSDESQILSWSILGTAKVWDAITGESLLTLSHESLVNGAAWSRDESQLLTRSSLGTAKIWDSTTGESLLTLSHENTIYGAVWNRGESQILSWSSDGTAKLWNINKGENSLILDQESKVYGAVWDRDGKRILSWDVIGTAKVWNAITRKLLLTLSHEGSVYGATWNKDSSRILSWGCGGISELGYCTEGTAKIWDSNTGKLLLTMSHDRSVYDVNDMVWNGDESRILSWGCEKISEPGYCTKGIVKIWDATTGEPLLILSHAGSINGAVWNKDSSRVLSWGCNEISEFGQCNRGTVKVWDAITGEVLLILNHESAVNSAMWNRDENQLLSWSSDRTAKVWDASTGDLQLTLTQEVYGAIWNGDGSSALSWGCEAISEFGLCTGMAAKVWDVSTGELLITLSHKSTVYGVGWNGNGSQLLSWSADGTVKVWDSITGKILLTLSHESGVSGAVWNEDESRILSWGCDEINEFGQCDRGTAKVWSATKGDLLFTLHSNEGRVVVANWSKNERQILLVTSNGTLHMHLTHTEELAEQACQYATRNFNWQEWQLYFPGQPYQQTCPHLPVHPSVPESARP